jgi:hypothetical protein
MRDDDDDFETGYFADFPTREPDSTYEIRFDRTATGRTSAGPSSVTLPVPFEIQWVSDPVAMTSAPKSFSRSSATPYFVVWDPFGAPDFVPGDTLRYEVSGSCIQTLTGMIDWSAGEDSLQLTNVLVDAPPPRDEKVCPLRVELTLSRDGTIDASYLDGTFVGEQVRFLELHSTP